MRRHTMGLAAATRLAILNANYIAKKLEPFFPILFKIDCLRRQQTEGSSLMAFLASFFSQHEQIQTFDFFPSPGSLAQELQARADAGVLGEAPYWNAFSKFYPPIILFKATNNSLKGHAVKWVSGLFIRGCFIHP
jgi:hypothetical protein